MNYIKYALLGLYGIIGLLISVFGFIRMPYAESLAKQHYRYAIGGVVIILLVLAIVVGIFVWSFNANNFKTEIVQYVKQHTQRDLVLQGDIKVTFFPRLGLDSGKMSLTQRNSAREFASVNNVRLYIAWLPLLHRQLVFDHVEIDGARINLIRFKDGTTNYDDLLGHDQSLMPATFDIDDMHVTNSMLNWQDEARWQRVALQNLQLETGRLADAVPSQLKASFHLNSEVARSDSDITLQSRLFYDRKEGRYEFADIDGTLQGTAAGFSNLDMKFKGDLDDHAGQDMLLVENIAVTGTGNYGQRGVEAKLGIPKLQLAKDVLSGSDVALQTTLSQFDEKWTAKLQIPAFEFANKVLSAAQFGADFAFKSNAGALQGSLSGAARLDLDTARKLSLSGISMDITASHTMLSADLPAKVTGNLQADLAGQNANLDFAARVDDSRITGTIALADFSHPAYTINLNVNRLPLDRYIAPAWIDRYRDDTARIDLSAIRDMNLTANLHVGEFRMGRLDAAKLSAEVRIEQSTLAIEPLSARLFGGTLTGSISVAAQTTPQITVKQSLKDFQSHELLAGTAGAGKLSGRGNLAIDVSAEGSKIGALRKSLSGNVMLAMAKGSIAGIDLRSALIEGKDDLGVKGNAHVHEYSFSENSGFSELKAAFNINEGSSHGNGFEMRTPQLRVSGEGDLDFDSGHLDYHLAATVASGLNRRNAGDLAALKGVTVPLRVSGPYTAPAYALDFAAASGGAASSKSSSKSAADQPAAKKAAATSTAKHAVQPKKSSAKAARIKPAGPE